MSYDPEKNIFRTQVFHKAVTRYFPYIWIAEDDCYSSASNIVGRVHDYRVVKSASQLDACCVFASHVKKIYSLNVVDSYDCIHTCVYKKLYK